MRNFWDGVSSEEVRLLIEHERKARHHEAVVAGVDPSALTPVSEGALLASTHPAWNTDGLYHCICGATYSRPVHLLDHVVKMHQDDLARRILSASQYESYKMIKAASRKEGSP